MNIMAITGVISADIVGSTSIQMSDKLDLLNQLSQCLQTIDKKYKTYSRVTKGDSIEVAIPDISLTMRITLIIKTKVKSTTKEKYNDEAENTTAASKNRQKRLSYFKQFGIRMEIDIDEIEILDPKREIIEGPAIYNTGRRLSNYDTSSKKRIVIKNTIGFTALKKEWENEFSVVFNLIDFIISKSTARQCEVLMYRLLGYTEKEIAELLKIRQPAVNQFSNAAGWREIEKALNRFETTVLL